MNSVGKKLILLSGPRTGSNFLRGLLSSHEAVFMYNELFNISLLDRQSLIKIADNAEEYVDEKLAHQSQSVVGFKLFYRHLSALKTSEMLHDEHFHNPRIQNSLSDYCELISDERFFNKLSTSLTSFLDTLKNDKSYYIVHLKRNNKLNSLLSLKNAFFTDQWVRIGEKPQKYKPIRLSENECTEYFNRMEKYENYYDTLFKDHNMLEVRYEDLERESGVILNKILNFLDLPYQNLDSYLMKQKVQSNSELIENFDDLRSGYKDTQWERFFI
ncbi:sulfotransferase [Fulvivirga sp. 29W222]|uniref:Sulfotransferase n=1 Tax=Fulvivirga marina TaxID=2494733 RepID=A0A937FVH8_9BACT|nr:sulfotransferase [Fulvivirga marina]MBL6445753.1 sulfotransferase [Fulvivirga marina]